MSTILVVDDDPVIRQIVTTVLKKADHNVVAAANGKDALRCAKESLPDLVVTDVMMDTMDGWTLVRRLRTHQEMSLIPVIFLTALNTADDRIRGFRLGADDYLAKPFRVEELSLRVDRVLRSVSGMRSRVRSEIDEVRRDESASFRGRLATFGLSALLTMMEMEQSSGVLVIRGHHTARIFLRSGRVMSATIEGIDKRGENAVFEILNWSDGQFEFSALDVEMPDEVESSTTHLLMEGARLIDEATTIVDARRKESG